jgi:hypothetical protein
MQQHFFSSWYSLLSKVFPLFFFFVTRSSLLCSQEATPGQHTILTSMPKSSCGLFPSGFLNKIFYAFLMLPVHTTCRTHLTVLDLIILRPMNSTNCKAPHCAVFCIHLLLPHSQVQTFSPAHSSENILKMCSSVLLLLVGQVNKCFKLFSMNLYFICLFIVYFLSITQVIYCLTQSGIINK